MDTVHENPKQMISVDPAAFSSMLMGVFDTWYKQRFGLKEKTNIKVITATTRQTTPKPTTAHVVQKKKDGLDKKALFKEFLALAMDYFKPKDKKATKVVKPNVSVKKVTKKKAKLKRMNIKNEVKAKQVTETATRRKVTGPPRITNHPPVLTRQSDAASPPAERTDASETRAATRKSGGGGGGGEGTASKQKKKGSASLVGKKSSKKKKSKAPKKKRPRNKGPRIDPEFLSDINEVRVLQGLPELTADQVDVYGNILPEPAPSPPPDSSSHDHGHSHSHSHSHDHGFGHGHSSLDYGFGYGPEAHIQSTIQDTHRRAHAMAGPLSDPMHRELHRLLKNREIDLRRDAWERRRYRSNLYGGSSVLQSVVDQDALRELVNSEIAAGPLEGSSIGR